MNILHQFKQRIINKFSYRLVLGLFCLSVLSAVSCDNDRTKTYLPSEVTPALQKVSFSASNANGGEGITLSDYSTVKLLITTDEAGKAPAHYYEGKTEKTFEAGGTEFTIEEAALSIHLESGTGQGKPYYVRRFDLDAQGKTSYRLSDVVSFKLKDTDDSKSVTLALVENKPTVEGEPGKPVSFGLSKAASISNPFFFYVQFQKQLSGRNISYYKGTDTDISEIKFKLIDENGISYYQTTNFFEEISKSGKAANKFKITLPAESRIYNGKKLTISEVSIKIGGSEKTFTIHYAAAGSNAQSIQKGGIVTLIPPPISTPTTGEYVIIEDANFRNYLQGKIPDAFPRDKGGKMYINSDQVKNLNEIDLGEYGGLTIEEIQAVKSLDGVQYFTKLARLVCANTKLTRLDLSQNKALTSLDCKKSTIKNLIIGTNDKLTTLQCSENNLTSLDLSGCTALRMVDCNKNKLMSLNLGNNSPLTKLWCHFNHLENLNLNQFKNLTNFSCYRNKLTNLDISHLGKLEYLFLVQTLGDPPHEYIHTGRPDFVLANLKIHKNILKGYVIRTLKALKARMSSTNIEVYENTGDTYSVWCHNYDIVNGQCND